MTWVKITVAVILIAAGLNARAEAPPDRSLEMTEVARQFPAHSGPTMLYLNFDGWTNHDKKGHSIAPFQTTTGRRHRDIQEILYRTSEIFTPFNVQVVRLTGDGWQDHGSSHNTTVFIGGDNAHVNGKSQKYPIAFARSSDYPSGDTGPSHQPDSQPFHLAFVDPIGQWQNERDWSSLWSNILISRKIAHEAGHTFGLAHVLSHGFPELMSYDAEPRTHFANRAFPTTDLNYNPLSDKKEHKPRSAPRWQEVPIAAENSFTYLLAVLGPRPADDQPNVADRTAVDPGFGEASPAVLVAGTPIEAAIAPRGDYDVFHLTPAPGKPLVIRAEPVAGSKLRPVLMAFDSEGRNLLAFATSETAPDASCELRLRPFSAKPWQIVVGAVDCATTGGYRLSLNEPATELAAGPSR